MPTVNGVRYSDKSPLLFWLIAGGWEIFGVHTWVARVEALLVASGVLLTLRRLAARLGIEAPGAGSEMWLLAGCFGFTVFSTAIMFDLLLSLAVLAPLWSDTARSHKLRWYLALLGGLLIGVAIALCWLLPAAWYAGPSYWQPLLDKVSGRIANSFAHRRPWWGYFPLAPALLLPWLLTLRAPRAAWSGLWRGRLGRFLWCWWVVPFAAFCAISGKQIHYLLPLLPAWAVGGAWLLFCLLALLMGAMVVALPWLATREYRYPPQPSIAYFALIALIVAIGLWRWGHDARSLALAVTALLSAVMLAVALAYRPALDVRSEATFVEQALRKHVAIAHVEWHSGLFGYTGRLHQPLPWIPRDSVLAWCRAHPRGILLTSASHDEPKNTIPFRSWPYFLSGDHRITAWRASDILKAQRDGR